MVRTNKPPLRGLGVIQLFHFLHRFKQFPQKLQVQVGKEMGAHRQRRRLEWFICLMSNLLTFLSFYNRI